MSKTDRTDGVYLLHIVDSLMLVSISCLTPCLSLRCWIHIFRCAWFLDNQLWRLSCFKEFHVGTDRTVVLYRKTVRQSCFVNGMYFHA